MNISDYFTIQFRVPTLSSDDKIKENKKKEFENAIKSNQSRLEAIELMYYHEKFLEISFVLEPLIVDLTNTALKFFGKIPIKKISETISAIDSIEDRQFAEQFLQYFTNVDVFFGKENFCDDDVDEVLHWVGKILVLLQEKFRSLAKRELETRYSKFRKAIFFQGGLLFCVAFIVLFFLSYRRIKYPPLARNLTTMQFLKIPLLNWRDSELMKIELVDSVEFLIYKFPLPSEDIFKIKVGFLVKSPVRIQLKEIKIIGRNGTVLKNRDFLVNKKKEISQKEEIESIHDLEVVQSKPEDFIELVTNGSHPSIVFNFGLLKSVAEIQIVFKATKSQLSF